MITDAWPKLTKILRDLVPIMSFIAAWLLDITLVPSLLSSRLHIDHMVLYTWLIYHPSLVSIPLLLVVAIIQDSIFGQPLGFSAILIFFFYGMSIYQRHHFNQHPFFVLWLGFLGIECLSQALAWILGMSFAHTYIEIIPVVGQTLMTVCCYPLLAVIILPIHQRLMQAR